MKTTLQILFIIFGLVQLSLAGEEISAFTLKNVERRIDLTTQLAIHDINITLVNTGTKPTSRVHLLLDSKRAALLAYIEARSTAGELLTTKRIEENSNVYYRFDLPSPLDVKAEATISVQYVFAHAQRPYPAEITQAEKQKVLYEDSHYFYTPYQVSTQTTTIKLASSAIESHTTKSPSTVKGSTITYGPYTDVKPLAVSALTIHFENTKPFLVATKAVREIEISHWGNVAVEETYHIENQGARLKGQFSRLDYQRNPAGTPMIINTIKEYIPATAADVYYRDEIGNISTSHLSQRGKRGQLIELGPRFPLFGGWQIGFYLGYNLPLYQFVSRSSADSRFLLSVPFWSDFDDVIADELEIRVIFPEGASDFEAHVTTFEFSRVSNTTHFTYLDTVGRPVLVIRQPQVTPAHAKQNLLVSYHFGSLALWREPFLLVTTFFVIFASVVGVARLSSFLGSPGQAPEDSVELTAEQTAALKRIQEQVKLQEEQTKSLYAALEELKTKKTNRTNFDKERGKAENVWNRSKDAVEKDLHVFNSHSELSRKIRDYQANVNLYVAALRDLVLLETEKLDNRADSKKFATRQAQALGKYEDAQAQLVELADDLWQE